MVFAGPILPMLTVKSTDLLPTNFIGGFKFLEQGQLAILLIAPPGNAINAVSCACACLAVQGL